MTTGKTIALTRWTSVGKVMSLFFNMLSTLVTGNLLQYSCLENPMDGGAWWATVHWGRKELDTTEWLDLTRLDEVGHSFSPKEQVTFNFMVAVTICNDFGAQENKVCHSFQYFPIYLPWSDGTRCHDLVFWMLSFNSAFSLSSFNFIKRLLSSSLLPAIRVVSFAYLMLLIFLPAILIHLVLHPAQHFSWCPLHIS